MIRIGLIILAVIVLIIAVKKVPWIKEAVIDAAGIIGSLIRFLK